MANTSSPQIIPAILTSSFSDFALQAQRLSTISKLIQIDIMDGKFVAEKSFADLKKINNLELNNNWEFHLMVEHPAAALKNWAKIKNLKRVIFHIESKDDPQKVIACARQNKLSVGIAINPDTNIDTLIPYLKNIDLVLFMTVVPGKQGQKFIAKIGAKVKKLKKIAPPKLLLAVDGGLNDKTIPKARVWGIQVFDVGSAIAKSENPKETYKKLQTILKTSQK